MAAPQSQSQPQSSSTTSSSSSQQQQHPPQTHTPPATQFNPQPILYTILLLTPCLALLPPRKLDLYTFSLGGAWVVSAREVLRARGSGSDGDSRASVGGRAGGGGKAATGVMGVLGSADAAASADAGPGQKMTEVREVSDAVGEAGRILRDHRTAPFSAVGQKPATNTETGGGGGGGDGGSSSGASGVMGLVRKMWMGDEGADWKAKRVAREREELAEGKGYGDIILGEVREVLGRDRETGERKG